MMKRRPSCRDLLSDRRGTAALEFALIVPVLLTMLLGIAMLGTLFLAQAGLRSTVEDAARYATTWPRPTEAQIQARMTAKQFGMMPANIVAPTVTFDTSSSPNFVTITMGYNITINYLIGSQTIALAETRRAYVTS
ncbi:MAG TPA: TadE/TadG family type IV pilus assembly protein [Sphingobium sp.]|nr:TadE/TadG family type IV pilus assembly protein [Sphingobium sp.]